MFSCEYKVLSFFIKENKHYKYKSVCILTIDDNICDHVVTLDQLALMGIEKFQGMSRQVPNMHLMPRVMSTGN